MDTMVKIFAVFVGGGIGSVLRFWVSYLSKKTCLIPFLGTFVVNIVGCFFIGYLFAHVLYKGTFHPALRMFLMTGLLGGLTTFSTFNLEVFELIKTGKILTGITYMILSCAVGLLFTCAGYYLFTKVQM